MDNVEPATAADGTVEVAVALVLPTATAGFASIGLAVTLHEGSTLAVPANSLRLLRFDYK